MLNSEIYRAKQYLLISGARIKGIQKYTPLNRQDVSFFLKTNHICIFFHLYENNNSSYQFGDKLKISVSKSEKTYFLRKLIFKIDQAPFRSPQSENQASPNFNPCKLQSISDLTRNKKELSYRHP